MGDNIEKFAFVISINQRKLRHWFIIQSYWGWFEKVDRSLYICVSLSLYIYILYDLEGMFY